MESKLSLLTYLWFVYRNRSDLGMPEKIWALPLNPLHKNPVENFPKFHVSNETVLFSPLTEKSGPHPEVFPAKLE